MLVCPCLKIRQLSFLMVFGHFGCPIPTPLVVPRCFVSVGFHFLGVPRCLMCFNQFSFFALACSTHWSFLHFCIIRSFLFRITLSSLLVAPRIAPRVFFFSLHPEPSHFPFYLSISLSPVLSRASVLGGVAIHFFNCERREEDNKEEDCFWHCMHMGYVLWIQP